jgi:hypothetical protein
MIKKRKKQFVVMFSLFMMVHARGGGGARLLFLVVLVLVRQLLELEHEREFTLPPPKRTNRRINDWAHRQHECEGMFRFPFKHLRRLFDTFLLPEMCVLENGSVYYAEEVFLLSLFRMSFPTRLVTIARTEFGRENTQVGRAFKFFINHMYGHFADLLFNNLPWWSTYFDLFAAAFQRKMEHYGLHFPPGTINTIALILDDVCRRSCRPGSGPSRFLGRPDQRIQQAFYSGWLKAHGLKYQTLETPIGCACDMYGPDTMRHNDLGTLDESNMNDRLAAAQVRMS